MPDPVLSLENLTKKFPGVVALDKVSFSVEKGEVHALVGQNGAGKSTLVKILAGIHRKDNGKIFIKGREVEIANPAQAGEYGLGFVHQELHLIPAFSAYENIVLGTPYPLKVYCMVDWNEMKERVNSIARKMGVNFRLSGPVSSLSISEQWIVAIMRVLYTNANIIVMDEPTAAFTREETNRLYKVIDTLKNQGVSIIYISHRLEEIFDLADRVTVLKDGKHVMTSRVGELNIPSLVKAMVGKSLEQQFPEKTEYTGEKAEYKIKSFGGVFSLTRGEVLGIAGLAGSGRSELAYSLFGLNRRNLSSIDFGNGEITPRSPEEAIKKGIALAPEERQVQGIIAGMSVKENMTLVTLREFVYKILPLINHVKERAVCKEMIEKLAIKTKDSEVPVKFLSGGNQQKVILSKWLLTKCRLLMLDEPTKGVDVAGRAEIYKLIRNLALNGISVIVISSEMEELMGICDRIAVMYKGKICKFVDPSSITVGGLTELCYGEGI